MTIFHLIKHPINTWGSESFWRELPPLVKLKYIEGVGRLSLQTRKDFLQKLLLEYEENE